MVKEEMSLQQEIWTVGMTDMVTPKVCLQGYIISTISTIKLKFLTIQNYNYV